MFLTVKNIVIYVLNRFEIEEKCLLLIINPTIYLPYFYMNSLPIKIKNNFT